jgi:hypothetical protein
MTLKKLRLILGSVTLCGAILLTAYHGNLDWMAILAFSAVLGLPEAAKLATLLLKKDDHDSCDPRP